MIGWTLPCDRLRNNCAGVAALEFALIAPVMVTMLFGSIELVTAFRIQAKLNVAAGQLVEMIAGQPSVTQGSSAGPGGTLGDMCTAAANNMWPYPAGPMSAYIGSGTVTQSSGLVEDWGADKSCPSSNPIGSYNESLILIYIADTPRSLFTVDGTPYTSGGSPVVGYSAIALQLTYAYTNILHTVLGSTVTFTASAAARPRSNNTVTCFYPSATSTTVCPASY